MKPEQNLRLIKYLYDALLAAEEVDTYKEVSLGNFKYNTVKWIVERGIEIISEALKRALIIEPNLPITDLNKIFATRNKIAHEYDLVDPYQIYSIVKKNIPILIEELKKYIDKLENNKEN